MIELYKIQDNKIIIEGQTTFRNYKSRNYYVNDANKKSIIHVTQNGKEKVTENLYLSEIRKQEDTICYVFKDNTDTEHTFTNVNDMDNIRDYLYYNAGLCCNINEDTYCENISILEFLRIVNFTIVEILPENSTNEDENSTSEEEQNKDGVDQQDTSGGNEDENTQTTSTPQ